jgi:hypothetical protein
VVQPASAIDPELKAPYKLRVVLHFADNRGLTEVFRDRVARELGESLQASFGDLAEVEVTRKHDRLAEVLDHGLAALDGWQERSEYKTHFVLIDFGGSEYTVRARQHDGLTGRAAMRAAGDGPLIRSETTRDREFVARTAALLVEKDFGLVGSFAAWPATNKNPAAPNEDQPVEVQLKGGGLGVPLGRWVQKGDVFAVFQEAGGNLPAQPVEGAVLVVERPPSEGAEAACTCRVFRRYPAPAGGAGFRCVRLGADRFPVRARLLQRLAGASTGPLRENLSVQINRDGFGDEKSEAKSAGPTNPDIDTSGAEKGIFDRVAFLRISHAGRPVALIPLPLLDDRPVALPVNVEVGPQAEFADAVDAWQRGVAAAWLVHRELFAEINALTADPKRHGEALQRLRDALKRTEDDHRRLAAERDKLLPLADKAKVPRPDLIRDLKSSDALLEKLKADEGELSSFLDDLEKINKDENDPEKRKWLEQVETAKRLERDFEYDQALALYAQAPPKFLDPAVAEHVAELSKKWKTVEPKLLRARAFVFKKLPDLDDAGLKANLAEARTDFEAAKAAGDKVTLAKMAKAIEAHAVRMGEELRELKPKINVEDEERAKLIDEVSKELAKIAQEIADFLGPGGGP